MILLEDVKLLRCPTCGDAMEYRGGLDGTGAIKHGTLACGNEQWQVRRGLPMLYREQWVKGNDKLLRYMYNLFPRLHNPAVRYMLPVMQLGGFEDELRGGYIRRLELEQLQPAQDRPLRILEVGIGAGANIELVLERLPRGLDLEYWGLDLSSGMLASCQRLVKRRGHHLVRLMLGDAHSLPFEPDTFDRVFHVGGIGGFNDPAKALAEMGRVALPGTPIVVVDEQLDPQKKHTLYHRAMFKLLTFYDDDPRSPVAELPPDASDILEEHVARFYYSLRFRVGG